MYTALTVLARRLHGLRAASAATWLPDSGNTGPVRLPVAFTPNLPAAAPEPPQNLLADRGDHW